MSLTRGWPRPGLHLRRLVSKREAREKLNSVPSRLRYGPVIGTVIRSPTAVRPDTQAKDVLDQLDALVSVAMKVPTLEPPGAARASQAHRKATNQRFCWSELVWWACQDLNLGPHPYQQNAGNRCARRPFRRSRPTVETEVMCSHRVQLCALILPRGLGTVRRAIPLAAHPHSAKSRRLPAPM
jgi:hypothetical protein